tara:strand:- start:2023 stop:2592 length:570 start_codon:yes stop_codon:yes gene_type:complete
MDSEEKQMKDEDFSDEDIDSLVEREKDWNMISDWQALLLAKKQSYTLSRINSLGYEYYNDTRQWDVIIEREWNILENRYNSGLGLEQEIIQSFGKDFFTKKQELEDEMDIISSEMEKRAYGSEQLTVYTYEDFLLLSNQGIFRDEIFIVDPQRKWKNKVIEHLKDYGYNSFEKIDIMGRRCIVVSTTTE